MTTIETAMSDYLRSGTLARSTRAEYRTMLIKWHEWSGQVPIDKLGRKEIREFLDWVYERAVAQQGTNPGRTDNKAGEQLRAVIGWAWDQELIDALPRFPKPKPQRDVAGLHYLTKAEINALYFTTHQMRRPRGRDHRFLAGKYWRCALVLFFNYGLDTGTVWQFAPDHEPILRRHVSWNRQSPDGQASLYCLLEKEGYRYAIRLKANAVLEWEIEHLLPRPVGRPSHQAKSRPQEHRVVAKIEWYAGELSR